MRNELVEALVTGGMGIKGISETEFYKFVISPDGLSQLGIPATEGRKLLDAYRKSFKTRITKTTAGLKFGDEDVLKAGTPHPASGTGKLKVRSWMEWGLFDKVVSSFGYVPRSKIPRSRQTRIRLSRPLGGLMLKQGSLGSSGFWSFPIKFVRYSEEWVKANELAIENAIMKKAEQLLQREVNR